ncbi:MAG TPA: SusC/RagA family TonB-linked outer membrane protein [Gemmatimonadaceae bacterium]|jgi:TonB-linked SusC/RagA family outer membrane protein
MTRFSCWLVASLLVCVSALTAHAQSRTVQGSVHDADTGEPLVGAQIAVKGNPTVGTLARDDGNFSLTLPMQDVILVVKRLGYPQREVAVTSGLTTLTIVMHKDVLKLDQIVVTGQASGISRRNLANSVATVDAEQLTKVPAVSIENALQGKVAGAQIQQNTGAPGGGNRIRLRGTSSILGNATPLYVVDGVITSDVAIAPGINRVTKASGTAISVSNQESPINRIADLNPDDIEDIEVLKGAAAAAIYGSKASGGVIMITTKRGHAGRTEFALRSGLGTARLASKEGSRVFPSLAAAKTVFDPNNTLGDAFWSTAYNPNNNFSYEDLIFGEKPLNYETALNVSGGSESTRYFVSTLLKRDDGIVKNTFADKKSLRLNLDQNFGSRVSLDAGTEVMRTSGDRGLFGNDNAGNSIYYTITKMPSFFDFRQRPDGTYPVNPFYPSNPYQTIDLFKNRELVWRIVNSGRLNVNALQKGAHEVRLSAVGGVDVFTQRNDVYSPPELQFEPNDGLPGTAVSSYGQNLQYNLNLNGVDVYTPKSWLSLTSQLGTQYEVRDLDQTRTVGQNLLGGLAEPSAGTVRDLENNKMHVEDFGVFVQSEALMWERFLLTAGMRADRSSNNGDVAKFYYFPKFATSYRLAQPHVAFIDEVKLRAAYGETGNQPQYGQKFTALNSSSIAGIGGFTLAGTRGFSDIRPERQRELEGGADFAMFTNRAQLELTGFERNISDLLIQRTLAPTSGFSSEVYNGASMRVRGFEAVLNAFPAQNTRGITWNTRVNFAMNRAVITKLPVAPFLFSTAQVGAIQIKEGQSATQLVGNDTVAVAGTCPAHPVDPTVCATRKVGDVVPVYMGDGNPKYTAGLGNEIRWSRLSLYGLFDRQKGGMLAAGTWRHFDLGQNSRDYDAPSPDPTKTLGKWRTDTYLRLTRIYYQDVSYWKLRELTLGYDVPERFTNRFLAGGHDAKLTLSGRNLKTWTNFRGGDPDFQNFGGTPDALQRNRELGAYPASKQYFVNLQVRF